MNKYSEQQKLDAVETYRSGELGLRKTAELHGVNVASLRIWVAAFDAIGIAGIQRKRRQAYDLKFKLEVLRRIEIDGLSHRQAAALFNIRGFSRIAGWERTYQKDGVAGLMPSQKPFQRGSAADNAPAASSDTEDADAPSRQKLLDELETLRAENAYLKKVRALVQSKSAPSKKRES